MRVCYVPLALRMRKALRKSEGAALTAVCNGNQGAARSKRGDRCDITKFLKLGAHWNGH